MLLILWPVLLLGSCAGSVTEDRVSEHPAPEKLVVLENEMQVMVLVDETAGSEVIEKHAAIVHRASPRLFVVRVEPAVRDRLAELPGVAAVTDGAFSAGVSERLYEAEALFAAAFAARGTSKQRVGNGLEWDAPGYEPPDPPPETPPDAAPDTKPTSKKGDTNDGP